MEKISKRLANKIMRRFNKCKNDEAAFHTFEYFINMITMTTDEEIVNRQYEQIRAETTKRCLEKLNRPEKIKQLPKGIKDYLNNTPAVGRLIGTGIETNRTPNLEEVAAKVREIIDHLNKE